MHLIILKHNYLIILNGATVKASDRDDVDVCSSSDIHQHHVDRCKVTTI